MYDVPCLSEIKQDFLDTLKKCHEVNQSDVKNAKLSMKLYGFILKVLAPLM